MFYLIYSPLTKNLYVAKLGALLLNYMFYLIYLPFKKNLYVAKLGALLLNFMFQEKGLSICFDFDVGYLFLYRLY